MLVLPILPLELLLVLLSLLLILNPTYNDADNVDSVRAAAGTAVAFADLAN